MNKGVILSLLVGGLIAGSYWEFVANHGDTGGEAPPRAAVAESLPESGEPSSESEHEWRARPLEPIPYVQPLNTGVKHAPQLQVPETPVFMPYNVPPSITNRAEVAEAIRAAYPPALSDGGIGGTVRVFFYIAAAGRVEEVQLDRSSGLGALDAAALSVAAVYRFSPALNRDTAVSTWASFPITFS
jgi:TonB family protein